MFSVEQRDAATEALLAFARSDSEIAGAAFVGSSATGNQDAWSDIDLMLQLSTTADEASVIDRWTEHLYSNFDVVHHLNVRAGNGILYRVFLTAESLQMDISFWPHEEFRAKGDRFHLIYGSPTSPTQPAEPDLDAIVGQAWLFAIHIRSALARNTPWYAASLLDTMRIRILELASVRHGLNPHQRREADQLPTEYLTRLESTYPSSIAIPDIRTAFVTLMDIFRNEIELIDRDLEKRLSPALMAITE